MFIGHGFCNDAVTNLCVSDANCPAGSYCPGGTPPGAGYSRVCIQQTTRSMWVAGSSNGHGNFITYGQNYGQAATKSMALGEDAASGSFDGAGTNGGTNVAVLVNSCGFRSRYLDSETSYMFAGVHSLMVAMPTNAEVQTGLLFPAVQYSDTKQWSARGSSFASFILANVLAAAGDAWLNPTMVNNGFAAPSGIPNNGANVILSKDSTLAKVQFHANTESWLGAQSESNDSVGLGYVWYRYACNYDCNTLGW